MSPSEDQYDGIAEAYRDSRRLPFRRYVEAYSLFEILGDLRGTRVLDLACGDGFYTRMVKAAGALEVTGVDLSAEMIRLAEEEERARPLGCRYLHRDAATLDRPGQVDLVVAVYLLNYARTREELLRFVEVATPWCGPEAASPGSTTTSGTSPGAGSPSPSTDWRRSAPRTPGKGM